MDGVGVSFNSGGPIVLKGAHREENLIAMEVIRRLSEWFFGCARDWDLELCTQESEHSSLCEFVVRLTRATLTGPYSQHEVRTQLDCHQWMFWPHDRRVRVFIRNGEYPNLSIKETVKTLINDMKKVVGETEAD